MTDALDRGGYEVLDRPRCFELLQAGGLGRIGVSIGALPVILPVHFTYADGLIQFHTLLGSTIERATRQAVVAFETDGIDDNDQHWSVAVTGLAYHLLEPGPSAARLLRVGIEPQLVSGRRGPPSGELAQERRGTLHH